MLQEERHLLVTAGLGDRLVVVKHESNRRRKRSQLVEQDGKHGSGDIRLVDLKLPGIRLADEPRASFLQRVHDVPQERARIILAVTEREPGEPPTLHLAGPPLCYQSRLAEAG